jgi:choline dehydrogenase-like flavoprotein
MKKSLIALSLPFLVSAFGQTTLLRRASGVTTDPASANGKTFDYIVVGGGLTGLTVAGRLSENPGVTVLVLEAGNDDRTDGRTLDVHRYGEVFGSNLDWHYKADQGKAITAGKTLGGGSAINGAAWTRGLNASYDAWSDLLESSEASVGWNWSNLWEYMKKAEGFSPPNSQQMAKGANSINSYHGFSGPVQVTFPSTMYGGPQQPAFAQTMVNLGLVKYKDLNGGTPNCVSFTPNSINWHNHDYRSSSASAYLTPVEAARTNWLTLVGHQVTKVNFASGSSLPRVATGVNFAKSAGGTTYTATARKEVILAAGALASPAILQLSGIGDSALLNPLGITTLVDLKTVGKNLQEQTMSSIGYKKTNFSNGGSGPSDVIAFPNLYQVFGSGAQAQVDAINNGIDGWAESQKANALSKDALKKIYQIQAGLIINKKAPVVEMFFNTGYPSDLGINMWPLLPFSRGSVKITSKDPFTRPKVTCNYFNVSFDLTLQIAGLRFSRKAFKTSPLSTLVTSEAVPGKSTVPDDSNNGSTGAWTTWLKQTFDSVSHPVGTCAMMKRSLGGVVDARLRVYDTQKLRVVDASVMPTQISAHLSSTLYGMAEKAADIIKADNT